MAFTSKWAFLVGVDKYKHLTPLNYPTQDVSDLRDSLLVHLDFPSDHIFAYCGEGEDASRAEILQQLAELENHVNEDDLLLFYFSGHGIHREGHDYLLPPEAGPDVLKLTALDTDEVIALLKKTGCKNVVMFLDACRAEPGDKSGLGDDSGSLGKSTEEAAQRAGIVSLFSCDPKDRSWEIEELRHGSFTHCLLQAVRLWECTTIQEIYEHLRVQVPLINRENHKPTQRPYMKVDNADLLKLPIFQLPGSREDYDLLANALADRFAEKDEPEEAYYNKAVDLLERATFQAPELKDRKRIHYIERLLAEKLEIKAFQRAWQAVDRVKLAPIQFRKEIGRITK